MVVVLVCFKETIIAAITSLITKPFFLYFPGVRSAEVSLIFDSTKIVVNPGDPLYLDCGVRGEMRSCIWGNENKEIFQVRLYLRPRRDCVLLNTIGSYLFR